MAYRPKRTRRVSRRRVSRPRARTTRRRRTSRRSSTKTIVIQLVPPAGGGAMSPYTLGKKQATPLLRARY